MEHIMLITLKKDELKSKIATLLRDDPRTFGHLGELHKALEIVESSGVFEGNWQLSRLATASFPPDVLQAVEDAQDVAQAQWRIELPPLGSSASPMN